MAFALVPCALLLAGPARAQNLVADSNFTAGDLSAWTLVGSPTLDTSNECCGVVPAASLHVVAAGVTVSAGQCIQNIDAALPGPGYVFGGWASRSTSALRATI